MFSVAAHTEASSASAPPKNDNLIEAACLRVLKKNTSMDKDDLFKSIIDIIPRQFKVSRSEFESRLTQLEKRVFLKIDPSGRVHYLP